jgi:hypothetical protein
MTTICQGHYKNGNPCRYKGKKEGYCLIHYNQKEQASEPAPAPEPAPEPDCAICYSSISKKDKIILNCKHAFCKSCIRNWLCRKNSCPCCRQKVQETIYQKLNIRESYNMMILIEFLNRIDFIEI